MKKLSRLFILCLVIAFCLAATTTSFAADLEPTSPSSDSQQLIGCVTLSVAHPYRPGYGQYEW